MAKTPPKTYACIDLKSFYASVECCERGLDPLTARLVVADETRTDGTICLAVSPALKAEGVPGRPRLFQVKQMAKNFIIAPPHMRRYMEYSARIYNTYLDFVAEEDILVYSIDEVFIDLTNYLPFYHLSAEQLVAKMIETVHQKTGITATAGIGPNLYLAKVAMDIEAKKMEPNNLGVRMATLDEHTYRKQLWCHEPLTDFWRIGRGYERKLNAHGIRTMGDVARASLTNEELLFKLFGVNAEFLIDHAWGYEPCTLAAAKSYRPVKKSISRGQVLHGFYGVKQAEIIVKEMVDELTLKMVDKALVSRQFVLGLTYSKSSSKSSPNPYSPQNSPFSSQSSASPSSRSHVRGTLNFNHYTSSAQTVMPKALELYRKLVQPNWRIHKISLTANDVIDESLAARKSLIPKGQLDLFGEYLRRAAAEAKTVQNEQRERRVQHAMLAIKKRYGKNAILRAMDFEEGATARERNREVGGHKG